MIVTVRSGTGILAIGLCLATAPSTPADEKAGAGLAERLSAVSGRAGGAVGIAVTHVETGETVSVAGSKQMPLFSVFKLPLAVGVLESVEEGKLSLEQVLRITPAHVVPGAKAQSDLWREPVERSVRELVEVSIVRSDNTSSDALLELIGGPEALTERLRALGFPEIQVRSAVRGFRALPEHPNTGSAEGLARFLTRLQKGEILAPAHRELLLGFMARATTGLKRLRGDLPEGTPVADKTGSGETVTNDVGIITLPREGGHLALAILISGSTLRIEEQERLIADLARIAYDHYAK